MSYHTKFQNNDMVPHISVQANRKSTAFKGPAYLTKIMTYSAYSIGKKILTFKGTGLSNRINCFELFVPFTTLLLIISTTHCNLAAQTMISLISLLQKLISKKLNERKNLNLSQISVLLLITTYVSKLLKTFSFIYLCEYQF